MNRRTILQRLVAALFGQQTGPSSEVKWSKDPLPPGEERCPLGHGQRPEMILAQIVYPCPSNATCFPMQVSRKQHICSICGIVYVKPEEKK